jgi:adenylate kinase family enzyme
MNLRNLDYRLKQADTIIFLDLPRYLCFWRIFKRCFKYYGKQNPSSASGCMEGINYRFFKFCIWVFNFKSNQRFKIYELLNKYAKSKIIYIVRSKNDLNLLIENLKS